MFIGSLRIGKREDRRNDEIFKALFYNSFWKYSKVQFTLEGFKYLLGKFTQCWIYCSLPTLRILTGLINNVISTVHSRYFGSSDTIRFYQILNFWLNVEKFHIISFYFNHFNWKWKKYFTSFLFVDLWYVFHNFFSSRSVWRFETNYAGTYHNIVFKYIPSRITKFNWTKKFIFFYLHKYLFVRY